MNQNPVYSMSTTETPTTDHEANHTHQHETVDTPIEMNQNPVYSATNIEADYYENNGLGPTRNEQQPEYEYIQVWNYIKQLIIIIAIMHTDTRINMCNVH